MIIISNYFILFLLIDYSFFSSVDSIAKRRGMAREESYKDFFRSCHSDEKPESVFGDSVKLSKGMRKTQDKMTKFCLRFSKLEL